MLSQKDQYGNYQPISSDAGLSYPTGIMIWSSGAGNPTVLGLTALPGSAYLDNITLDQWFTADGTTWVLIAPGGSGGGAQMVTYTSGTPANPPNINAAAMAYDPTGNLSTYGWDPVGHSWH